MNNIIGTLVSNLVVYGTSESFYGTLYTETESEADTIADIVCKHCNVSCEIAEIEDLDHVFIKGTNFEYVITWKGYDLMSVVHHMVEIAGNVAYKKYGYVLGDSREFKVIRTKQNAVIPTKAHVSDSGYDVTIVDILKEFNSKTKLYGTGLKVIPPYGYYFELVPRSSISKTGYMLANNVGIIDQSYRGELMVALIKIDENAKDIELPCRIGQLIPRKYEHMFIKETNEYEVTQRDEGGFGSSNPK